MRKKVQNRFRFVGGNTIETCSAKLQIQQVKRTLSLFEYGKLGDREVQWAKICLLCPLAQALLMEMPRLRRGVPLCSPRDPKEPASM